MVYENCDGGKLNDGDTAWMLFATTFVMLQTPATGIAQAGLVRRKNALSMIAQSMVGVAIGSALWFIIGFSLTFGSSTGGVIGNFDYVFFINVSMEDCLEVANTIPAFLYASYMMMFALMVPVIVTGAWAEKLKFPPFVVFCVVWPFLVYYPIAHWIWAGGGWLFQMNMLDFAGGLVIHTTAGVAALIVSLMLEARNKAKKLAGVSHNVPLTAVGMVLVFAGWYSFNGGSALKANFTAATALLNTQISACMGMLTWCILSYLKDGTIPLTGLMSGILSGLAGVTPASGYVAPQAAFVIGILATFLAFWSAFFLKKYGIDDVLDVTALQAVPGITGTIVNGFAAHETLSGHKGIIYGGDGKLLGIQLLGTVVVVLWTAVWTFVLLKGMEWTVGIVLSNEEEEAGLDNLEHGEKAYHQMGEIDMNSADDASLTIKLCDAAARGDVDRVILLLRQGACAWKGDYDSRTPLHVAAAEGHMNVVRLLNNERGVDINAQDRFGATPLQEAVRHGHDKVIEWLKKMGAELRSDRLEEMVCSAAIAGDATKLGRLMDAGADPNITDYDGRSALHLAATGGHVEVVKLLLAHKADPSMVDRWGGTAYQDALRYKHHDVIEILRDLPGGKTKGRRSSSRSNSSRSLRRSGRMGKEQKEKEKEKEKEREKEREREREREERHARKQKEIMEAKRKMEEEGEKEKDQNRNNQSELESPRSGESDFTTETESEWEESEAEDTPLVDRKKKRKGSNSTISRYFMGFSLMKKKPDVVQDEGMLSSVRDMLAAASEGDIQELKRLIVKGADPDCCDYDKRTPLHLAATEGHLECVQFLVARGVNVNAKDRWNNTPLADAQKNHHAQVVHWLASNGGIVIQSAHSYALCQAAAAGDLPTLQKLKDQGADIRSCDYDGRTPLHLASAEGHVDVVKWLIKQGAVVDARDRWGGTPRQDALRRKYTEVDRILREAGAKLDYTASVDKFQHSSSDFSPRIPDDSHSIN